MRKFSEFVLAMSPESQQRVADRVESALNEMNPKCTKCDGTRTVPIRVAFEYYDLKSCPHCSGTGKEPQQPYYVI